MSGAAGDRDVRTVERRNMIRLEKRGIIKRFDLLDTLSFFAFCMSVPLFLPVLEQWRGMTSSVAVSWSFLPSVSFSAALSLAAMFTALAFLFICLLKTAHARVSRTIMLLALACYAIGYGLTETAPLLAGAAPSQVRLGSTGPAAPGVQLRLENVNPDTQQGEIVALTPSVMLGYYKNPEETAKVFTPDGWFRTGDLGWLSPDGWLYIKGRLKNMIVGPSGENIYPEEIESVLNSHVFVADSLVTEKEGRLIALVHFNRDELEARYEELKYDWEMKKDAWEKRIDELKKEVLDYVNSQVNRFSRLSEVVEEKEEFEMTPTKKIKRFLYNKRHGKDPVKEEDSKPHNTEAK